MPIARTLDQNWQDNDTDFSVNETGVTRNHVGDNVSEYSQDEPHQIGTPFIVKRLRLLTNRTETTEHSNTPHDSEFGLIPPSNPCDEVFDFPPSNCDLGLYDPAFGDDLWPDHDPELYDSVFGDNWAASACRVHERTSAHPIE